MNDDTRQLITQHLSRAMERLIERRCVLEPFDVAQLELENPFGAKLVPVEIWKGAKFERSFVTVLGQGVFEQLAKVIAEGTGAYAVNQYNTRVTICTWRLEKIDSILSAQRTNRRDNPPDWRSEINQILALQNDRFEQVEIISDLYIRRPTGVEEFYSIKTVKPNLDQTERAKRDMLRLVAANPNSQAFFALPFNPAGEGQTYRSAKHTVPYKIFNMDQDEAVLIGSEFWNKVGQSNDTYEELLGIFTSVGNQYSPIIRQRYLGL